MLIITIIIIFIVKNLSKITYEDIKNLNVDSTKLAIGYLIPYFGNGGIERSAQILTKEFAKRNITTFLLTEKKTNDDYELGENVIRVQIYEEGYKINKKKIEKFLSKYRLDILIYNNMNFRDIEYLNSLNKKLIICDHAGFFLPYFSIKDSYKRYIYFKKVNACTFLIKNDICLWDKQGVVNSFYIQNPLLFDIDKIIPSKLENNIILMLGRADKNKKYELGIKAMPEIVKEIPNAVLYIAAKEGNKYMNELKSLTKKLNITKNVIFLGYVKNVAEYYQKASVFILTSLSESFSHVLAETKSYGLPNIITGMNYLEIAKNGTIHVGPDDINGIAKETIKLLKDKNYRMEQGKLARESMVEFYTNKTIDKWINLFHSLTINDNKKTFNKLKNNQNIICDEKSWNDSKNEYDQYKNRTKLFYNFKFEDLFNMTLMEKYFDK